MDSFDRWDGSIDFKFFNFTFEGKRREGKRREKIEAIRISGIETKRWQR